MKSQVCYDPNNPSRAVTEQQSVGACGLMLAAKRPFALPTSPESVQSKRSKAGNDAATSTSITSSIGSDSASESPARLLLPSEQHHRVRVFTQFSEHSFFRGLPKLSVAAVSFMEVNIVNYSPPPHPELPRNVPSHLKKVFSQCSRAAKMAWIAESGLAEFPAGELSDEHLDKLYKAACRKLARHQKNPQATSPQIS